MTKYIKLTGVDLLNSMESTFGNSTLLGNKLVIPFYNIFIMETLDETHFFKKYKNKYLKYCFLLFEDVSGITWNYKLSRAMSNKFRECYGGVYYYDKKDYEFWVEYREGFILIPEKPEISSTPWENIIGVDNDFFHHCWSSVSALPLQ